MRAFAFAPKSEGRCLVPVGAEKRTSGLPIEILVERQHRVTAEITADGGLIIRQETAPETEQVVEISAENVVGFIDRLTDVLGVPTVRGAN